MVPFSKEIFLICTAIATIHGLSLHYTDLEFHPSKIFIGRKTRFRKLAFSVPRSCSISSLYYGLPLVQLVGLFCHWNLFVGDLFQLLPFVLQVAKYLDILQSIRRW